jgi:hypothetical protein
MSGAMLAAGAALLGAGAMLAWSLVTPTAAPAPSIVAPPAAAEAPALPIDPDAAAVVAALARPPFAPGRRPPAAAIAADGPPAALPSLVAVALGGGRGVAMLRLPDAERPVRARPGERVGGFLLIEVLRDRVVLLDAETEPHTVRLPAPSLVPEVPRATSP